VTRPYHSPSSLAKGERCHHAWALHYIDGLIEPSYDWADIEAGRVIAGPLRGATCPECHRSLSEVDGEARCVPCGIVVPRANARQRGASIGTALHSFLEAWYRGEAVDWTSTVGQIAAAGEPYLPDPDRCHRVEVETSIGLEPTGLDRPPTSMLVHGVRLGGFRDLVAWPNAKEAERLGYIDGEPVLIDYKGTSDVAKWAKPVDVLRADNAANAYALDVLRRYGGQSLQCRWLYFQTKRRPVAAPVDFVISVDDAYAALRPAADLARELDRLTSSAAAPRSPLRCTDYLVPDRRTGGWSGGCEYHCTAGGPCDQLRPLRAFFHLADRLEQRPMASLKDKFNKAKTAPATPPPETAPATPPVGSASPPPPAEDPAAPPPAATPAKPRNRRKGQASPPPMGDAASYAERKAAAEAKIAEGQAELAAVVAEIAAARDALAALLPAEDGGEA